VSAHSLKSHKSFEGLTQFWEHESTSTKTKMKFATFIPAGPVKGAVIWLSGLTCTDENFITKAGAQKHLAEHQLMVICPDTSPRGLDLPHEHESYDFGSGASFYLDATTEGYRDHYRMETYVVAELVGLLQKQFGIATDKISLMGHSMGGHGALVLGLRHPEIFRSVSAFSPLSHPTRGPWGQKALAGYLGTDPAKWAAFDATELIKGSRKHPHPILIDQGTADEFLEKQLMVPDFVAACKELGQPLEANFREGYDHSYYFIASFIENHVRFHAKAFR
jgi:S-formylglutathione hydrolase